MWMSQHVIRHKRGYIQVSVWLLWLSIDQAHKYVLGFHVNISSQDHDVSVKWFWGTRDGAPHRWPNCDCACYQESAWAHSPYSYFVGILIMNKTRICCVEGWIELIKRMNLVGTGFAWDVTGRSIFKLNCHRRLEDYIAEETIVFKLTLIWFSQPGEKIARK